MGAEWPERTLAAAARHPQPQTNVPALTKKLTGRHIDLGVFGRRRRFLLPTEPGGAGDGGGGGSGAGSSAEDCVDTNPKCQQWGVDGDCDRGARARTPPMSTRSRSKHLHEFHKLAEAPQNHFLDRKSNFCEFGPKNAVWESLCTATLIAPPPALFLFLL